MDIYVSNEGNDQWSGSLRSPNTNKNDGPFKTLERARDKIRTIKKEGNLPERGVTVWLRGGYYQREHAFELTSEDSGTVNKPVIYRAYENEQVHLIGGKKVVGFQHVTDPIVLDRLDESIKNRVMQVDLKSQGITDFGSMKRRGKSNPWADTFDQFGNPNPPDFDPAGLEVFFKEKPMQLARYPNEGWLTITGTPSGQHGGLFTSNDPRPKRWEKLEDVWVYGYWTYEWADSYEKIKDINTSTGDIVTEEPHAFHGYMVGKRFYYLNILEELDTPGEWYLDRNTGILYFYPPEPLEQSQVLVSLLEDPLISMDGTSHVIFQNLILECTRGLGVKTVGGSDTLIAGCTLRNIGTTAVNILGGKRHGVLSCDIFFPGEGGILVTGGDRKKLISGEHYIMNNHFSNFDWRCTYRPAVGVGGVGNRIAHNLMHDAKHSAIFLRGNDHLIEFNEIYDVCMETDDAGAFYMGRNITERGNIIRHNYFHHMGLGETVMAVYLDDCASGSTIFGNCFFQAGRSIQIGGGRDNRVENNIFIDGRPAIRIDARAVTVPGFRPYFHGPNPKQIACLKEMPYKTAPWSERYPELVNILDDDPAFPKGNKIIRNINVGFRWLDLVYGIKEKDVVFEDNMGINTVNLDLASAGDGAVILTDKGMKVHEGSPAFKLGFKDIPEGKIGLYKDEYRKEL